MIMSTFTIEPVRRHSAKVVIMLAGQTGEGKTYSALQLALGLANMNPEKIGLLDTENRRGSFYADIFPKPFQILDFPPPFSPARYVDAMTELAATGIEVMVIDSGSHEHEGQGGLEEIAANPNKKIADWLTAKREHRKFMNTMLQLPCHVILCLRAREKMDFKNPQKPVSLGILPICEKNVAFEATVSFLMRNKGKERDVIKLPEVLKPIFDKEGYLTAEQGLQLRKWIGGTSDDLTLERAKNHLRLAASKGMEALREAFGGLAKPLRAQLTELKDTLKDQAENADRENAPVYDGSPEDLETREEVPWSGS